MESLTDPAAPPQSAFSTVELGRGTDLGDGARGQGMDFALDSWLWYWLCVCGLGVLWAAWNWWVGGWWYRVRLRFCGATETDPERVRLLPVVVYLFMLGLLGYLFAEP